MIQKLVALALRMPFVVLVCAIFLVFGGLFAYRELDIEAYPNPVPPMVEIISQPDGWSSEEVERYVTVPLEIGMAGMPALDHIRSQSLFGLSDVKCYFTWSTTYEKARQEVINRLQFVQLSNGVHHIMAASACAPLTTTLAPLSRPRLTGTKRPVSVSSAATGTRSNLSGPEVDDELCTKTTL